MNNTISESLIDDLVTANLILFNEGVLDAFGHVSVRNPHNRDHFFLARNMAPGLVTKDDLREYAASLCYDSESAKQRRRVFTMN